ncbi:hypothetical protein [Solidesulfovibrio alcoholivorans]|uniref:hypothetical protein n=1 Tax=Solidesulfovibrio alcoholivorans TaxID=81406 RepID=UPI0012EB9CD4|nr:hypothetical protein [Solidesulfovibrio alcoholivorans]
MATKDYDIIFSKVIETFQNEDIKSYIYKKLQEHPLDIDIVTKVLQQTIDFENTQIDSSKALDEIVKLKNSFEINIIKMSNYDKATKAFLDIQTGKLLIIINNALKEIKKFYSKSIDAENERIKLIDKLFKTKTSKARHYDLMKVAKIPYVENFCFLGIELLVELTRVIPDIKSDNPILEILYAGGYVYDSEYEDTSEDFIQKIKLGVNKIKFASSNISVANNMLEQITKQKGIVSGKDIEKVEKVVKRGTPLYAALELCFLKKKDNDPMQNITFNPTTNTIDIDLSPSYNQLEETCLKLTDMMEDIFSDDYVPDHSPERFVSMLEVLHYTTKDLMDYWAKKWDKFDDPEVTPISEIKIKASN